MKTTIIIIVGIFIVIVILGLAGNLLYTNMMHAMVSNIKVITEKDDAIIKIEIEDSAGKLVGYVRSTDFSTAKKTIIYLPGSGDIAYNSVYKYGNEFNDYVFICVDYPGAKESEGKMNQDSILNTGLRLYDYLMEQDYVDSNNINIMGYSYSTGIMTYLASQRDCEKLVLIAPYRDSADMYNRYSPIYYGPMRVFISENFKTDEYAKTVQADTLLITSSGDRSIKSKYAYSLQNDFQNAQVKEYKNIKHVSYFDNVEVVEDIRLFFEYPSK